MGKRYKPVYVGESQNIGNEVNGYLQIIRKVEPLENYRVRAGRTRSTRGREMVEHAMIRLGNKDFGTRSTKPEDKRRLRNLSSFSPFKATKKVTIKHKGQIPKYLRTTLLQNKTVGRGKWAEYVP